MSKAAFLVDGPAYFVPLAKDRTSVRAAPAWLERLGTKVAQRWDRELSRIHLFDAVVNPTLHDFKQLYRASKARRSLLHSMRQAHVYVHEHYFKPYTTQCEAKNCPKYRKAFSTPVPAGIDVGIATVALAELAPDVDTVILFISQPDYVPLIKALDRTGKRVVVVCDERDVSWASAPCDVITVSTLMEHYPTLLPKNLEASEDVVRREDLIQRNPDHRHQIASAKTYAQALRMDHMSEDDKQALCQVFSKLTVDKALANPRCPNTFIEALAFIEDNGY